MGLLQGFSAKWGITFGRSALAAGAAVALWAGFAEGQATTLLVPQGPLLPERLGELQSAAPATSYAGEAEQQAVLREDGLRRGEQRSYGGAGAERTPIQIRALEFDDATGAVSAFTLLRSGGMRDVPAAERAGRDQVREATRTLLREGVSVVIVDGVLGGADLHTLVISLPKVSGPKGLPPLLPTYLPAKGLLPGTVHYALGQQGYRAMGGTLPAEILGFTKAAEVATANYTSRGGHGVLTLLLYPTPQIAGDRGRAIETYLNQTGVTAGAAKLRREGPLVILVTGFPPGQAQEIADGIHLRTELTWNKPVPPEFHVEVQKTASLLVSIATFSAVGALAAILLGLFLGGGRAAFRVMRGKPAATEPEFLSLGLGSGPESDSGRAAGR